LTIIDVLEDPSREVGGHAHGWLILGSVILGNLLLAVLSDLSFSYSVLTAASLVNLDYYDIPVQVGLLITIPRLPSK